MTAHPRVTTEHPEPLSSEEIAALRRNVEGYTPGSARRTRTLRLLATIGSRDAEIAALRKEVLKFADQVIKLGGDWKEHDALIDALRAGGIAILNRAEAAEAALAEAVGLLRSIRGMFNREGYPNVALDAYLAAHPAETPEGTG